MYKKMPQIIILIVVLTLFYQNCQKPPQSEVNSSSADKLNNTSAEPEVIANLDQAQIENLVFTDRMPVQMNQSGKVYTLLDLVQFSIDWQSGVIQQLTSQNQLLGKYCLQADALNALKLLLVEGQVCQFRSSIASGQMCAQMVIPGYMKLLTSAGEVEVGLQSDSCGTSRTEFCDDRGSAVKEWFSQLKVNLGSLSCK